jgi:LPXTG-motif cell wall-anchored protein
LKIRSRELIIIVLLSILVPSSSAGVAISGSFYSHNYVLALGEEISGKDIYVVAFNTGENKVWVDMEYEAPEFIEVEMSPNSSLIAPGDNQRVYITLKATDDAIPGNYTVKVTAIINEVKGDLPVKVLTSAAQEATVTISGEYGEITVVAMDPVGNIAQTAQIRLFRDTYDVANGNGTLEKRVVPGTYTAKAYLLGEEVASEEFEVAPYEDKRVELPIRSVYFELFDVLPAKDDQGNVGYIYTVSVIKNLYKELPDAAISLHVSGAASEDHIIYTSPSLPLNRTEIKYNYIPVAGWKKGDYEFTAKVTSEGVTYAISPVKTFEYKKPITENPMILIGIALIALLAIVIFYKRRKRE